MPEDIIVDEVVEGKFKENLVEELEGYNGYYDL
jgi:hypothetical protein